MFEERLLLHCIGFTYVATTASAMNVEFITYNSDFEDGFRNPLSPAYDVLLNFSNGLFPCFPNLANSSNNVTSTRLWFNSSISSLFSPTDFRRSDTEHSSMINRFYEGFYASINWTTAPLDYVYSEIFFVTIMPGGVGNPFDVLRSFFRETTMLVATVDPTERPRNPFQDPLYPSTLNLISSRDSNYYVALKALAERFSWTQMTVICDCELHKPCPINSASLQCAAISFYLSDPIRPKYTLRFLSLRADNTTEKRDYDGAFQEAGFFRRTYGSVVVIVLLSRTILRRTMIEVYRHNMANGDYVFISIIPPTNAGTDAIFNWKMGDSDDAAATAGFKALIVISKQGPDWSSELMKSFVKQVNDTSLRKYGTPMATTTLYKFQTTELLQTILIISQAIERQWQELPTLSPATFLEKTLNQSYLTFVGNAYLDSYGVMHVSTPIYRFDNESQSLKTVILCDPVTRNLSAITNESFHWFGHEKLPSDIMLCELFPGHCFWDSHQTEFITGLSVSIPLFSGIAFLLIFILLRRHTTRKQYKHLFLNTWTNLEFNVATNEGHSDTEVLGVRALYMLTDVYAKKVPTIFTVYWARRNMELSAILLTISHLKHQNLTGFYGVYFETDICYLCSEFCPRGSLTLLVHHSKLLLDTKFRLSFIADIIEGLCCIHKSYLKFHGGITNRNCLVNSRFTVKISQTGYNKLGSQLMSYHGTELTANKTAEEHNNQAFDVRSVGLLCLDLLTNNSKTLERTWFDSVPEGLQTAVTSCLKSKATERPSVVHLEKIIRRHVDSSSNVTSLMMTELEKHAQSLQLIVAERTADLVEETKKVDIILRQMLPVPIIIKLRNQELVAPEMFESTTIMFSDIPAFSDMVSQYIPLTIVQFLNYLYSTFDGILSKYDVYKVETINDSYVVSSGVPIRNGNRHAAEICLLSLQLLAAAKTVSIPSAKELRIDLRIGVNSGTIAAGIMGTKRPRYCLFGDTMNTASRMESHGKENHIHVGKSTKDLADSAENSSFEFVSRGIINIKGKGQIETFWLTIIK